MEIILFAPLTPPPPKLGRETSDRLGFLISPKSHFHSFHFLLKNLVAFHLAIQACAPRLPTAYIPATPVFVDPVGQSHVVLRIVSPVGRVMDWVVLKQPSVIRAVRVAPQCVCSAATLSLHYRHSDVHIPVVFSDQRSKPLADICASCLHSSFWRRRCMSFDRCDLELQ